MRIISLVAENVKKIMRVEVRPDAGLIQVSGPNDSGKSSLLDAIEWGLAGDRKIEWMPIRAGQERATITMELGEGTTVEYRVTKLFKVGEDGGKTIISLRVEDPDGAPHRKPQSILAGLLGNLTLDPIEFMQKDPTDRLAVLKGLVPGVDWQKMASRRQRLFDLRTERGREAKRLEALVVSTPEWEAPDEPVDTGALMDKLSAAAALERVIAAERQRRVAIDLRVYDGEKMLKDIEAQVAGLKLQAETIQLVVDAHRAKQAEYDGVALPEPIDVAEVRTEISKAENINRRVEHKKHRAALVTSAGAAIAAVADTGGAIEALDAEVAKAIAEAELPVRGLSLGERDVMLNGVPFDQASFAQQLRASLALAMAENPTLRVIRIRRGGNDLDAEAMGVLREVAQADGFDIWIERVVPDGAGAIVMEAGNVRD